MPNPSIFTSVINSYLPEPHASLLNGIIFGISLKTSKIFFQELKIVGLLHLVVLSGINITLLAAIIGSLTSFFSKRVSILLTILTIILFILFVGPQAPIVRAGIMGILTLVAILYGRKTAALYALFLSGFFILIFWPSWIKTVSFQLSFAATFGIIIFGKTSVSKSESIQGKIFSSLKNDLRTSLAAQIFTAPIIFIYFKQVSFVSPLANLLVSFLVSPLMIFGFLTAILGKISFWLGLPSALISFGLLQYMVFIIKTLAHIPFAFQQF